MSEKPITDQAIAEEMRAREGNPQVQEYLNSLKWDGVPRIDKWLSTYLQATETDYTNLIGRLWMIGAVARALKPGCMNSYVMVLEGVQGCGKSKTVRILGTPWHTDMHTTKDAAPRLANRWIVELTEVESLRPRDSHFFHGVADCYRVGRQSVNIPRACIFVVTGQQINYLRDTSARFYWPVRCGAIDLEGLARDRDQLWAEAVAAFKGGGVWWLSTDEEAGLCAAEIDPYIKAKAPKESETVYVPITYKWSSYGAPECTIQSLNGPIHFECHAKHLVLIDNRAHVRATYHANAEGVAVVTLPKSMWFGQGGMSPAIRVPMIDIRQKPVDTAPLPHCPAPSAEDLAAVLWERDGYDKTIKPWNELDRSEREVPVKAATRIVDALRQLANKKAE